jgi:RNA polymerase sigma-70 factor (ECF subfamily)
MTDSEIIRLILQGDRDKFRVLVDRYQTMVFHTCLGYLHNKDDADDLTQEVFIQVFQSLKGFKGDAAFSTWIYRITINASLNKVRKSTRNPVLHRLDALFGTVKEKEFSFPISHSENPESILIRQEHSEWLQKALDKLPDNQKTAIVLSKYDNLSQKEIAEIMNTTEGAVEALIQRAKMNLRIKLSSPDKKK